MIKETVKLCGLSRREILERLDVINTADVSCDVSENFLDAAIVMSSDMPAENFELVKTDIYNLFKDEIYSATDISLQDLAVKLLNMTGNVLGVAESLTGGGICSRLISVPGISANFYEGVVCYNSKSKIERLGVSESVIARYGAVSRETARAMVRGVVKQPVTIGLATTGLAGPEGDEGKPVGLVYIGVGGGEFITVFEKRFNGSRNEIRESVVNCALFYLIRYLKGDVFLL